MVKVKMFSSIGTEQAPAAEMPELDTQAFYDVVDSRRSTRIYAKDEVPDDVIARVVDAAQKAPNSSNLQCWELYRVKDDRKKSLLVEACLGQPAAATAPELFVFVARPDLWKRNNAWTLQEFDRRGNMPERAYQYFTKITRIAYTQGAFAWVKRVWFPIRGWSKATPREPIGLERHACLGAQEHGSVGSSLHACDEGRGLRHLSDGRDGQQKGQTHFVTSPES